MVLVIIYSCFVIVILIMLIFKDEFFEKSLRIIFIGGIDIVLEILIYICFEISVKIKIERWKYNCIFKWKEFEKLKNI